MRRILWAVTLTLSTYAQSIHVVKVNPDGSFSPRTVYVKSGDTVRWEQITASDSVIPVTSSTYPAMCSARAGYDAENGNDITGPVPFAPSGVFVMGIHGNGYRESTTGACPGNASPALTVPGKQLCPGGAYQATLDSTWKSANNTGVFVRLLWKDVNPGAGVYDFTVLQREMEQAVRNGKLFSLSIKAGMNGTPDWIFSTNANDTPRTGGGGGVPRLHFEDNDDADTGACGFKMDLGNPTNSRYQQIYFDMITATAKFIRSRADWYRALAYIKTSGANFISEENRMPKHCDSVLVNGVQTPCICNPKVFAQDGYRPSGLYAYYDALTKLLKDNFPGKAIDYALIQDGFPRVNETGGWETESGAWSDGRPLPAAFEITQTIMDRAQATYGTTFVVAHNGVQPKPSFCNFEKQHPKPVTTLDGYWQVGSGCPNRWAVREGAEGQITGYQTTNAQSGVGTVAALDSAFQNAWDNTDGIYMELYEELFWLADNANGGRMPVSGKTLGEWAAEFHKRRVDPVFPKMFPTGNPFPSSFSRTLRNTNPSAGPQVLTYIHGLKCGQGNQEYGQIIIDALPPAIKTGGMVTASGFGGFPAASPGSWIEIYGTNLSNTSRSWTNADFSGSNAPSTLDDTTVRIGGQAAFLSYVSPGQINAQIPSIGAGSQPVTVTTPAGTSTALNLSINATQPGLSAPPSFSIGGRQYVVAVFPDGSYVLPPGAIAGLSSRRARPGETISLYGVGFGAVTPSIAAGQIAQQFNTLAAPFQINFGSARVSVTYSGLAPGAVGLYQFNVVVPQIAAGDAVPVTFTLNGVAGAQTLYTAIQD